MESHFKTCSKCKETKPRGEFSKNRSRKGGLHNQCKACKKKYYQENREQILERKKQYHQKNRERRAEYDKQYHQENREQILERKKQYYQENREYFKQYFKQYRQENRERRAEYQKQYYQENREYLKQCNKQWRQENSEYVKRYRQENREQMAEYNKQWRQENPEKVAAKHAKRRALKRGGMPDVIRDCPIEKSRVEQIYKLRDLLTKATGVEYHVDHIWPLSKGGPHWSGNLQIITAEENLSKNDTLCEDTARVIQESLDEHLSRRQ